MPLLYARERQMQLIAFYASPGQSATVHKVMNACMSNKSQTCSEKWTPSLKRMKETKQKIRRRRSRRRRRKRTVFDPREHRMDL